MKEYDPSKIEKKWQEKWQKERLHSTDLSKDKKYYVLTEFTYPSGDLHMGHWFTWVGSDIFARFKRLNGFDVFFPNGFDAFGLPAENAAIKRNIHPQDWTMDNIIKMKEQYSTMGASFSFDHEVITCLPEYYHWNQWIFLKLLERGLAYQGKSISNWCPQCQTVLANEGVEDGKCWRCGTEVVQKEITQWFFKITDYADKLIWPENPQVDWPRSVCIAQNEWIGKSEGAEIEFEVKGFEFKIKVFTTRPDTIYGATYVVVSPEHKIISQIKDQISNVDHINEYVIKSKAKTELERKADAREKTGVKLEGVVAVNPANKQEIPIWVADYVLPSYGTGAIMAVPAHDTRDFEFAKKYQLPIKQVIEGDKLPYVSEGKLKNSGELSGMSSGEAAKKILEKLDAKVKTTYHLRDWSISRQRYWGTPIPIIHCGKCGPVPVPKKDLPIELPYDVDYQPKGKSPLASNEDWINVKCPVCDSLAKRDADTMDTFVDSSWYFYRYLSPKYKEAPFEVKQEKEIMPVDIYFGGGEHTLGHTLYSRFISYFFNDIGMAHVKEYAARRINHGIVLGPDGNKMSKSKGNVINPDEQVKKYGADAVRTYLMFYMPYTGTGPWRSEQVNSVYTFLKRVWDLSDKVTDNDLTSEDRYQMHATIKKVSEDIGRIKFNTAVAALMKWLNYLEEKSRISLEEWNNYLILLSPFAPHITEELWNDKHDLSIHTQNWPVLDKKILEKDILVIPVQVNGKVRSRITINRSDTKQQIEENALRDPEIKKWIKTNPSKIVYVPLKIVNFICKI